MATILLDSNVVLDLADPAGARHEWAAASLEKLDTNHRFVANPMVYAEVSIGISTIEACDRLFFDLALPVEPIQREALFLAGKVFLEYRRRGGGRSAPLPDFFIGAHAAVNQWTLMTRERGRYSTYFPKLTLILPW